MTTKNSEGMTLEELKMEALESVMAEIDGFCGKTFSDVGSGKIWLASRFGELVGQYLQRAHAEGERSMRERAAKSAEDYDGKGLDSRGYHDQLGDASKTRWDIEKGIRALAILAEGKE